jgi:hypothetical protein
MQFLSLGLLPPQDAEDTRVGGNGVNGASAAEDRQGKAGSSTLRSDSTTNQNSALGMTNNEESNTTAESRTSPQSSSTQSNAPAGHLWANVNAEPKQTLPPGIEELREKLHDKAHPRIAESLAASVDSLALAERGAVPTFGTFKFGYLPARGLLYSVIGHEVALFGLFLLFTYGLPTLRSQKLIVRPNSQDHLVYLPELGGGSEGQKSPGGGPTAAPDLSAAPAHASKGFAYPGAQPILSDPPNPTNAFQTVQRPLLVHPETIRRLIPLPNIIQTAETRLPSELIAPKAAMPHLKETPKPIRVKQDASTHRDAKFQVPVNDAPQLLAKTEMPKLPAAEQPLPEAPKVQAEPKPEEEKREVEKPSPKPIKVTAEKRAEKSERQVSAPSPAQIARMEMHGKAKEPLLSLSPMPAGPNAKIPAGEARGRFAIAPGGTLNPNSLTPGKMNVPLSSTPGMGRDKTEAANAASDSNASSGNGAGHAESGGGGSGDAKSGSGKESASGGIGAGKTSGEGAGGNGVGKGGRGIAGKGAGAGSGRGSGTGSGAGSGSGSGSFPGITIQGGEDANANSNPPSYTIEQQAPYDMTVVSTASSGGGLEDFGVFHDERIFTVYIPMKRSEEEADPTWTLQYAPQDDSAENAAGQVLAPAPATREWPEIPPELQQKYAQRQVVISALVDKEGKVSNVTVKRTPDTRVSAPIAQALSKWIFHPAQINGQPVAVKVLFGIPL